MTTIYQSQDVAFHAPSLKDAVIMLPLMDALSNMVNRNRIFEVYENLPENEKDQYKRVWQENNISLPIDTAEKILNLLKHMGYESQIDLINANTENLTRK